MPVGAIYCGRPGVLGNPFMVASAIEAGYLRPDTPPEEVRRFLTECFEDWLTDAGARCGRDWWQGPESDARKAAIWAMLPLMCGRDLVCWCPLHHACHVDIYLRLANR